MHANKFEYLNADNPLAIAHRGGALEFPENSFKAFEGAHRLGFRYMETDVQLTKDGELVTFHDPSLERVVGEKRLVSDLEWTDIKTLEFQSGGNIPRLVDLFEAFPDTRFNIDMKSDEVVQPLFELVQRLGVQNRVCLASFYDHRIAKAHDHFDNKICTSAGRYAVAGQVLRGRRVLLPRSKVPAVQVPVNRVGVTIINQRFIERAHRDGKHVHVWTIDQPKEINRLLDLGVNGIMTDKPSVLKAVLMERGQWLGS